jgi:hypothetical protein
MVSPSGSLAFFLCRHRVLFFFCVSPSSECFNYSTYCKLLTKPISTGSLAFFGVAIVRVL